MFTLLCGASKGFMKAFSNRNTSKKVRNMLKVNNRKHQNVIDLVLVLLLLILEILHTFFCFYFEQINDQKIQLKDIPLQVFPSAANSMRVGHAQTAPLCAL